MQIFQRFVSRPGYAGLLILLLVLAGSWALYRMPVDYFPGLNYPLLNIITQYPGAAPEDVELLVTRPIESEVQSIRGVRRTSSISAMGVSQVTVEFSEGYDLLAARQLVSAALSRLTGTLPPNVHPVIDNLGSRLQQIVGYTVSDSSVTPERLRQLVQFRLVPRLRSIPGISRIQVMGGRRSAIVVEPDLNALRRLNLSLLDLEALLQESSLNVSGRYIEMQHLDIPISGRGQVQSLEDVRHIPVRHRPKGPPIFLQNVAKVFYGSLPEHYLIRSNGRPAVAVVIQKSTGYSTTALVKKVDERMAELRGLLPPGAQVQKFYDQSEILGESLAGVRREIWIGAILAVLVIFFFLRKIGPTLIVSVTIPLALLAAAALMTLWGLTLNMMTLAALTLSVGMVVDDAVIVMENIQRHLEAGRSAGRAVLEGTRQILAPDVNGTVTTLIVFVPLLFISGFLRQLILPFGLTIGFALAASLLLSLTVIPALMHWRASRYPAEKGTPFMLEPLLRRMNRLLHWTRSHKKGVFGFLVISLLTLTVLLALFNPVGLLPPVDEGALLIEYVMRPGVSLRESYRVGRKLMSEVLKAPDVENVYLKIGSPENTFYIEGVNRGELHIKLDPRSRRSRTAEELLEYFRRKFSAIPGVVLLYHQPTQENIDESFSGLPAFFGISVSGDNLDSLAALSRRVERVAGNVPGISGIMNQARFAVPEVEIIPNRPRLAYHNLTAGRLLEQVSAAFRGKVISYFIRGQAPVAIFLRLPPGQRNSLEALKIFPVRTAEGVYIPLSRLASVRLRNVLPRITHLNGRREITLISGISGNLFAAVRNLKKRLKTVYFPPGYSYRIRGQYRTLIQSGFQFILVMLAAVVLIYAVLYLQFNSFWQPLVILLKIPLDFTGAFAALLLTRQPINLSVAIGLLTLVGVAVNNAIVLIDFANGFRSASGVSPRRAMEEAVRVRMRPVLMTGLTTIFGLIPAAVGMGVGSRIHQPFAVTVIGGMITGIFFSLNVIPALYEAMERRWGTARKA